jgi:hypothetical protein
MAYRTYVQRYGMSRAAAKRVLRVYGIHYNNALDLYQALNRYPNNTVVKNAIHIVIDEIMGR